MQAGATPQVGAEIVDLVSERVTVRFVGKDAPVLAVGQEIALRLGGPETAQIGARVLGRHDRMATREYKLGFVLYDELIELLPPPVRDRIERRRAPRVTLDQAVVVSLHDTSRRLEHEGRLLEVSEVGAGVLVDADLDEAFCSVTEVYVQFRLPGTGASTFLLGWLRRRLLEPDGLLYGVEFDLERSPRADQQARALRRFVEGRMGDPG